MIDIIDVRTGLMIELNKVSQANKVYYEGAPEDAAYPYLIYSLTDSDADGANTEVFQLYINGWDLSDSTTVIENMMVNLNEKLDKVMIRTTSCSFRAELDNRLTIDDTSDARIKRREYRYALRVISTR
jgi:hypothetical protein